MHVTFMPWFCKRVTTDDVRLAPLKRYRTWGCLEVAHEAPVDAAATSAGVGRGCPLHELGSLGDVGVPTPEVSLCLGHA